MVEGFEHPGPILAILQNIKVERVILLETSETRSTVLETRDAIEKLFPLILIESRIILEPKSSKLTDIIKRQYDDFSKIHKANPEGDYFINIGSGTEEEQAGWNKLIHDKKIPAHAVFSNPRRVAEKEKPELFEIVPMRMTDTVERFRRRKLFAAEPYEPLLEDVARECGCIGDHPLFRKALNTAAALARHDSPILIQGKTGTGKDVLARLIHRMSERADKPLITVNCASIPETLAESLLFGHKKGAFTGAIMRQKGKFELADGGTLLLDELGELSLKIQAKLLRVIEYGETDPLGSTRPYKVNVRIIASTNKNLNEQVGLGNFRDDLYYRLRVGEIWLPTLRERRSDISKLALYILERINNSLKIPKQLCVRSLENLEKQPWPGNIRDLQNVIERAAMLCPKSLLEPEDLQTDDMQTAHYRIPERESPVVQEGFSMEKYLGAMRKRLIFEALEKAKGNKSEAARLLGISPQAVHQFLKSEMPPDS